MARPSIKQVRRTLVESLKQYPWELEQPQASYQFRQTVKRLADVSGLAPGQILRLKKSLIGRKVQADSESDAVVERLKLVGGNPKGNFFVRKGPILLNQNPFNKKQYDYMFTLIKAMREGLSNFSILPENVTVRRLNEVKEKLALAETDLLERKLTMAQAIDVLELARDFGIGNPRHLERYAVRLFGSHFSIEPGSFLRSVLEHKPHFFSLIDRAVAKDVISKESANWLLIQFFLSESLAEKEITNMEYNHLLAGFKQTEISTSRQAAIIEGLRNGTLRIAALAEKGFLPTGSFRKPLFLRKRSKPNAREYYLLKKQVLRHEMMPREQYLLNRLAEELGEEEVSKNLKRWKLRIQHPEQAINSIRAIYGAEKAIHVAQIFGIDLEEWQSNRLEKIIGQENMAQHNRLKNLLNQPQKALEYIMEHFGKQKAREFEREFSGELSIERSKKRAVQEKQSE